MNFFRLHVIVTDKEEGFYLREHFFFGSEKDIAELYMLYKNVIACPESYLNYELTLYDIEGNKLKPTGSLLQQTRVIN